MLPGLVIFLMSGCARLDADGDGHSVRAGDCDDADVTVYPGAQELCDGLDNDCDNSVDEEPADASTFYADADADGYPGTAVSISACEAPEGFSAAATDCDDLDPSSSPEGMEVCDGADNDCDGLTDEDDEDLDADSLQTFYIDGDGDGYGTDAILALACELPEGFSTVSGDCDDNDPTAYPGLSWFPDLDGDGYGDPDGKLLSCSAPAGYLTDGHDCDDDDATIRPDADEVCDDIDNDCDGLIDDDDTDVDPTSFEEWLPDADGDGYGGEGEPIARCLLPDGYSATGGDCDDADAAVHPAATEVCDNGVDDNCDESAWPCGFSGTNQPGDAGLTLSGSGSNLGYDLAVGDLDGDGIADLIVPGYAATYGTTFIAYGPTTDSHSFPADEDASFSSSGTYDYAGKSVASGGDVDGDGYDDLLVGAYGDDDSGNLCGAAFLISGGAPLSGALSLDDDAAMIWYGSQTGDTLGTVVRMVGDLDDDGMTDIVLGGRGYGSGAGGVYLIYGATSLTGIGSEADADASLLGDATGDAVGDDQTVAGTDLDGDGYDDLVVGISHSDLAAEDAGVAALIYGGHRLSTALSTDDADALLLGGSAYDYLGIAVAAGGDLDADGYDDLLVGASGYDATVRNEGATWVLAGQASARSGELDISAVAVAWLTGGSASDYSGSGLSGAGDFDGDGSDDILIGATGADNGALSAAGAGYLVYGPLSGAVSLSGADAVLLGSDSYIYTGQALAAADINADGLVDVLISSYGADTVYAFFGGGL